MIIDCHRHLSLLKPKQNFQEAAIELLSDMEKNNINKTITIADNVVKSNCADIDILLKTFEKERDVFFIGAINPFDQPKEKLDKIEKLVKEKKIIGLKLFNGHDKLYPTDQKCFSTYKLCIKYNIPVMIHTGINTGDIEVAKYNDPKYIVEIAKKFPDLKIIIAHYFWPKIDYCYQVTRNVKNIYFDTSALADSEVIEASGGIEKIKNVLKKTIERNKESVLFGTDYPECSVKAHINLINSLDINNDTKNKIFSDNAKSLFKI